jgi:nucleoside-diphosphate-sugar epimerase
VISNLIHFYGKKKGMKIANLRLYSVYGPFEDSSRLIPQVILKGLQKEFTTLTNPDISRDFIYISMMLAKLLLMLPTRCHRIIMANLLISVWELKPRLEILRKFRRKFIKLRASQNLIIRLINGM